MKTPEEIKNQSLELAGSGKFITGIYNYCDRWCEKCAYTSKCLNYATSPDYENLSDEDAIKYVSNSMQAAKMMLDDIADEMDIDLSDIPEEESASDRYEHFEDELSAYSNEVSTETHNWLNEREPETGIRKINSLQLYPEHKKDYHEALEVVLFYLFFISVKLDRAARSAIEAREDEYMIADRDGSAKVALIALDRTINAWAEIMKERSEYEDDILAIINKWDRVRSEAEKRYQNARSHIRPGLDEA